MPLINRRNSPPGGFPYREPRLQWAAPRDGATFDIRARQIQTLRLANPTAGLDPTFEACASALDAYTCERLGNDPAWCATPASAVARTAARASRTVAPCPSCGKRRTRHT